MQHCTDWAPLQNNRPYSVTMTEKSDTETMMINEEEAEEKVW